MELRTVFTFLRAAELRNFSKAADSLGYAQSTVTMQIQQLEEELGKPLFDRFNRSIALTAFGESFLPLARRMYSTAQEMHALSVDPAELTGTLRIGLVESLFFSDFLKLIPKYQALMPNVVLDFSTGSSVEIVDLLTHNKLDLGSYFAESSTTQELVPLFERGANTVFVANPKHPLCQEGPVTAARLSQERFVMPEGDGIYHRQLRRLFQTRGLNLQESIRLKSTHGIVDVLKYSGGLSFLPEFAVRHDLRHGNLKVIECDLPPVPLTVTVATHREKWISPQMQGMIQLLSSEPWL